MDAETVLGVAHAHALPLRFFEVCSITKKKTSATKGKEKQRPTLLSSFCFLLLFFYDDQGASLHTVATHLGPPFLSILGNRLARPHLVTLVFCRSLCLSEMALTFFTPNSSSSLRVNQVVLFNRIPCEAFQDSFDSDRDKVRFMEMFSRHDKMGGKKKLRYLVLELGWDF